MPPPPVLDPPTGSRRFTVCWMASTSVLAFIASVNLPLNLDQNRHHAFHQQLTQIRAAARMTARTLPVVST
jgi:hypothetical protein